jgi:hypothetical protein
MATASAGPTPAANLNQKKRMRSFRVSSSPSAMS